MVILRIVFKHLNYVEKTQIEKWYNIERKPCLEIESLLTIQREIKKRISIKFNNIKKYVYSADVLEQKCRYNMTINVELNANYKLVVNGTHKKTRMQTTFTPVKKETMPLFFLS